MFHRQHVSLYEQQTVQRTCTKGPGLNFHVSYTVHTLHNIHNRMLWLGYTVWCVIISAAKVLRRPCGRLFPSIPLPSFLSPPRLPFPSAFPFLPPMFPSPLSPPSQPLFLSSFPSPPLISRTLKIQLWGLGEYCNLSFFSGVWGGAPAEIEFGAF